MYTLVSGVNLWKAFITNVIEILFILDFRCSLCHWPQYGKHGLWSTVEDGTYVARIKAK